MSAPQVTERIQNVRVSNSEKLRLSLLQCVPAIGPDAASEDEYREKLVPTTLKWTATQPI